tara:strand:- start:3937 stop:6777 length:2841 start_codon:yes stop_codon:yes gene_type:complete
MLLGNLLRSANKNYQKIPVKGISFDSRKVKKNYIFFAINGRHSSGLNFVNEAISRGASLIVSEKKVKYKKKNIPLLLVKDVRKSLSEACSKFYKKKLPNIIAVTGTNGKSSVVNFFYQILNFNKMSVASIGTLGIFYKNHRKKMKLTSMDPLSLHKSLKILSNNKVKNVILEASSHGLDQKRLDYLKINTGIFTNLSHDHLDYHKNIQSYLNSKMYLFKNLLKKNSTIITDQDNKEYGIIKKIAKMKKITIGTKSGNIKILNTKYKHNKQFVEVSINSKNFTLEIPLIGYFQVKNLLMAVLAAINCGLDKNKIFDQIKKIKPVPGRLECVASLKNNSNIIVDFAHTPDALDQSLAALKNQFKKEIIIVFGCGGDRDKNKRPKMGKIASKYCRKIFITDDNPRYENPNKIRSSIAKGCKKLTVNIGNRAKAIETAINELKSNEVLLVAGKGHEETQDYGNKIINFSDKKLIKKIIRKKINFIKKTSHQSLLFRKTFNVKNFNDISYSGVSINTKTIKKNNIFFSIKGKNTDGHKFAKEAFKKGAEKLVVSQKVKQIPSNKIIKVKNTLSSLNTLAKITRDNSYAKIIGITGSVGKTTLKNLISFSLRNYGKVHHSPHSYNNKFGVPLSVSNLKSNIDYGVFEIGMDKKGEIGRLSKIVKPEIAVITNIAGAHFKNFNSLKDIAKAKAEIIKNITKEGNLVLNKDGRFFDYFLNQAKKEKINVTSFSLKKKTDIYLLGIKKIKNFFILKINIKNKIFYFKTRYSTDSFINNLLACISVMFILNLDIKKMSTKFVNFEIPEGRGDISVVKKFNKKFKFIDESYNANPLSMISAIKNMSYFSKSKCHRKFAFFGDMLELGKNSQKLHRSLSTTINKSGIDKVFVHGNYIEETFNSLSRNKKGKIFKNLDEAYSHFGKILHNNDLLMVKGSNATGLNQFSKNIKKGQVSVI